MNRDQSERVRSVNYRLTPADLKKHNMVEERVLYHLHKSTDFDLDNHAVLFTDEHRLLTGEDELFDQVQTKEADFENTDPSLLKKKEGVSKKRDLVVEQDESRNPQYPRQVVMTAYQNNRYEEKLADANKRHLTEINSSMDKKLKSSGATEKISQYPSSHHFVMNPNKPSEKSKTLMTKYVN